ncbi:MAG: helix-turn-helix transcriptional regulator [Bacillota bacterium]|nr:helix-turn-helix transcriptional regulator [Bacillota bacterium]
MSTKLNKPNNLKEKFDELFNSIPEKDKLDIDAKVLMFRFLEIVEEEREKRDMNRKDLADILGVRPAFVSQLFNGNKLLNLVHMAKLQKAFGFEFEVRNGNAKVQIDDFIPKGDGKGVWVYKPFAKPDYEKKEVLPETGECFNIVA